MDNPLDADLTKLLEQLDQRLTQALDEMASHPDIFSFSGRALDNSLDLLEKDSRLHWLAQYYALSLFDLFIIGLALTPELDRGYENIYTNLQNDLSANLPTVDLVLNLFSSNNREKLVNRRHFSSSFPLLSHQLITLTPNNPKATFLTHYITLDGSIVRYLLQQPGLDLRLTSFCQLDSLPISPQLQVNNPHFSPVLELIKQYRSISRSGVVYFQGVNQFEKGQFIQAIAQSLSISLLTVNLRELMEQKDNIMGLLSVIFREALLIPALLYFDSIDIIWSETHQSYYPGLLDIIKNSRQVIIISGKSPWNFADNQQLEIISIPFPKPTFDQQKDAWNKALNAAQINLGESEIDILCDRFSLLPEQITNTVTSAIAQSQLNNGGKPPQLTELINATRQQFGQELAQLAKKVNPKVTWNDLILPPIQKTLLERLCHEYEARQKVYYQWKFAEKSSKGIGLNVLFSGLPGTGKTMAAEVIAHQLQLDLYKIDLSQIVSKYIGETEKNLNRIFEAASAAQGILFFDEADALFGKRSEVKDAHDRYANIEIGYLLQKMEEYEGIAILTTNLRGNLDPAFERRLRFIIEFPLPDQEHRLQIWRQIFPSSAPISTDIDWHFLAEKFELTGADIRNIALNAAFLAAKQAENIEMSHILGGLSQEYRKTGRILRDTDLGKYSL